MRLSKAIFLLFAAAVVTADAAIHISNRGYSDVVVSVSPDVPATDAKAILDGIVEWITEGSQRLYEATFCHAYIKSVKILVPQSWPSDFQRSSNLSYQDGHIKVGLSNPLYLNRPHTEQVGTECGEMGVVIHTTPDFFKNLNSYSYGNLFVQEWSKFRYGNHEEHGFPGDRRYPMFLIRDASLAVNACTDRELYGHRLDFTNGGSGGTDPATGLPDENCTFVADGDNSAIQSSVMAAPFLDNTADLCVMSLDGSTHAHLEDRPTKQNVICRGRSAWYPLDNSADIDFTPGVCASPPTQPEPTEFAFLRESSLASRYVLVLDASRSMEERIERVKQAAIRWTERDLRDGSFLGVVRFSTDAETVVPLTLLDQAEDRYDVILALRGLEADGEGSTSKTCIGSAIKEGVATLNGLGGVLILVTDSEQGCDNEDESDLQEVYDMVKSNGTRIVTISVANNEASSLDDLAVWSDGRAFLASDDSTVWELNTALQESLAFQPAQPMSETSVTIFSKSYSDLSDSPSEFVDYFAIDESADSKVVFQLDYNLECDVDRVEVEYPDGTVVPFPFSDGEEAQVFEFALDSLQVDIYGIRVVGDGKHCEYSLRIAASPPAGAVLPPLTASCWTSAGLDQIDLSGYSEEKSWTSLYAKVEQGKRPVRDALVRAFIGTETFVLLDNGAGADLIANDGIYSRFLVSDSLPAGRHSLYCTASGQDATRVLESVIDVDHVLDFPLCCGSDTDSAGYNAVWRQTGVFSRPSIPGGMIRVAVGVDGLDGIPPARVLDLVTTMVWDEDTNELYINVQFTAMGDDLDKGTVDRFEVRYSKDRALVVSSASFSEATLITEDMLVSCSTTPQPAGTRVSWVVNSADIEEGMLAHVFFAVKSWDKRGAASEISNVAEIFIE